MNLEKSKKIRQKRRKQHIRKRIFGNPERLRLSVNKSLKHITAQIIDQSQYIGGLLAKRAKEANISIVAFDRNGHLYHGRLKALADAAREGGLQF